MNTPRTERGLEKNPCGGSSPPIRLSRSFVGVKGRKKATVRGPTQG